MTESPVVENGVTTNGSDHSESCVLHVRRLPQDITDSEVANLAVPFGGIKNMVVTKKSGQALIEMPSVEAAKNMLHYYTEVTKPFIRRPTGFCNIAMQFSRYSQLSTNGGSTQLYAAINQANEQAVAANESGPRCVIRVQVENYPFQIPLSHLLFHQMFSRFGTIKRIITFMGKRGTGSQNVILQPQALIEFDSKVAAHVAKLQMHQCILSTLGGHMLVDFSKQSTLEVRHENNLCRDYILHPLTDVEMLSLGMAGLNSTANGTVDHHHVYPQQNGADLMNQQLYQQPSIYPNSRPPFSHPNGPPPMRNGDRTSGVSQAPPPAQFLYQHQQTAQGIFPLMQHQTGVLGGPGQDNRYGLPANSSPVLIISQLNADKITPDILFNLFGVYGEVVRVKVMFSKRDTALVQFYDACQAALALENLNGCPLFGNALQVNFSRHMHIKMPPPGAEETDEGPAMTKDYSESGLHRFRRSNTVRSFNNVYSPSSVLHVSNIPADWTDEQIANLFKEQGYEAVQSKLMLKEERKMVLLQYNSLDDAIIALVMMHNHPIEGQTQTGRNNRLRVCFSRIHMSAASATQTKESNEAKQQQA